MNRLTLSGPLLVSLAAGSIVFAQLQTSQKPKDQSGPRMMMCPMISKTEGQAGMGNMQRMMQGMMQAMPQRTGRYVLSLGGGNLRPAGCKEGRIRLVRCTSETGR